MLKRILPLFILAATTVLFAAGADLGAGTKADEINVPAVLMFFLFVSIYMQ